MDIEEARKKKAREEEIDKFLLITRLKNNECLKEHEKKVEEEKHDGQKAYAKILKEQMVYKVRNKY